MLKTVEKSGNSKTGPIAVTYRSGEHSVFGTCPANCALNPRGSEAAQLIDKRYLNALLAAVPPGGQAWTYSHFPASSLPIARPGQTVINASCDSIDQALAAGAIGRPAVVAAPFGTVWPYIVAGVRFVRCPAETVETVNCGNCGNGRPLCARADRNFVVVFVGHGSARRLVGQDTPGGCYGSGGRVAIQWHATRKTGAPDDAAQLRRFARALPPGSLLRHHVVGDIGRAG